MIVKSLTLTITLSMALFHSCIGDSNNNGANKNIPPITFTYVKSYPHDTNSFTEGLLIHNGKLYESTGATKELPQTKSLFGIVDLVTGKIDVKAELDSRTYFGEGIAILKDKVYQLTYRSKIGFVYDTLTFQKIDEFDLPTDEGWGLTSDGTYLIMSNGTYELTYLDPVNFKVIKKLTVTENGNVKEHLNELEYINGYIFANIWTKNVIVKIDPKDGKIVSQLDLSSLANEAKNLFPNSLEMNGIAYDSITNNIFVTGKLWPKIYELKIN